MQGGRGRVSENTTEHFAQKVRKKASFYEKICLESSFL